MASLKDRFAARQRPSVTVPLRMEFSPQSDAALTELAAAEAELETARARGWTDLVGLERSYETAKAAVGEFYVQLVVRSLPPDEMDALVEAHPPTEEQKAQAKGKGGTAAWSPATFGPALLAACVDSDMTESDWAELTSKGPVSSGEVRYLLQTALDINDRSPNPDLGKG